jgi:hypothetical protein
LRGPKRNRGKGGSSGVVLTKSGFRSGPNRQVGQEELAVRDKKSKSNQEKQAIETKGFSIGWWKTFVEKHDGDKVKLMKFLKSSDLTKSPLKNNNWVKELRKVGIHAQKLSNDTWQYEGSIPKVVNKSSEVSKTSYSDIVKRNSEYRSDFVKTTEPVKKTVSEGDNKPPVRRNAKLCEKCTTIYSEKKYHYGNVVCDKCSKCHKRAEWCKCKKTSGLKVLLCIVQFVWCLLNTKLNCCIFKMVIVIMLMEVFL